MQNLRSENSAEEREGGNTPSLDEYVWLLQPVPSSDSLPPTQPARERST